MVLFMDIFNYGFNVLLFFNAFMKLFDKLSKENAFSLCIT